MSSTDEPEWLTANRALWNEWAGAHAESAFYDLQGFIAGRDDLRPWEPKEVGSVKGQDLIHLQCHLGTASLQWARRGARVTALDFSSRALRTVRGLSNWSGVPVTCIEANVYDAVAAVGGRRFDVVYTGVGAINWLPNLDRWAAVVADLLKPGGILYLYEIHPVCAGMADDGSTIAASALGNGFGRRQIEGGSYATPTAVFESTEAYERVHGLGELFTSVLAAGLDVELFREFELSPIPYQFLERRADGLFGFPRGAVRFPLTFSLRARRPS